MMNALPFYLLSGPPQITSEVVEVAGVMGQQVENCELYCTVLFCTALYCTT